MPAPVPAEVPLWLAASGLLALGARLARKRAQPKNSQR